MSGDNLHRVYRFLKGLLTPSPSKKAKPLRRYRPRVEALEEKIAPAVVVWSGAAGGGDHNWSNGANWVGGVAPGAGDTAQFNNNNVRSVVDAGFAGTVANIEIDSGYTASFEVASNLTVTGSLTCNGSTSFTIDQSKTLTVRGDISISAHSIINDGTTTWTGGSMFLSNGGVFWNTSLGIFNDNGGGGISNTGGGGTFTNSGAFNNQSNGGDSIITAVFNDIGPVAVTAGDVSFRGGGTFGGTFDISPNDYIFFQAGSYTVADGTVFTGDSSGNFGTVVVAAQPGTGATATVTVTGNVDVYTNLQLLAGTLNGSGTAYVGTSGATVNWSGGTMQGGGETLITPLTTVNIQGTATKTLNQRMFLNYGSIIWTGTGNIQVSNGARIVNDGSYSAGSFDIQNDQTIQNMGGADSYFNLVNGGRLTKSAGTGLTDIQMFFQNYGGTISLQGRRVQVRQLLQDNNGALNLNGGELDVTGAFTQNSGTTQVDTGTLSVGGQLTENSGQITMAGGNISATGGVDLASSSATLSGSGTVTGAVQNGGDLVVGQGASGELDIIGAYTQASNGILDMSVQGSSASDFLKVTGLATLNGLLRVGGSPAGSGSSFTLMDWGSRSGQFAGTMLPAGTWQLLYDTPPGYLTLKEL